MNCPACREPLVVLEQEQVELDHCLSCKGIWLDSGELELLLEDSREKDRLLSSFEIDRTCCDAKRKCPICSKKMESVLCGEKNEVRIDRCPEGDGLWFDLGELERIIQAGSFGGSAKVLDWLKETFGKKNLT